MPFLMKILVFIGVPSVIGYIFWITYKHFRRTSAENNSEERNEIDYYYNKD